MARVLVVYGSRHGGTRGIAERIGDVLRASGLDTEVSPADAPVDAARADAVIVGSGVYMGSWLKEPLDFMQRNLVTLATRPLWIFSSGPLPGSNAKPSGDPVEDALGPAEGVGSGGRKKVAELSAATHPRDHRVFTGAFDPKSRPAGMAERLVRRMPAARNMLPAGDFRDWPAIDAWANEIARELRQSAPSAG